MRSLLQAHSEFMAGQGVARVTAITEFPGFLRAGMTSGDGKNQEQHEPLEGMDHVSGCGVAAIRIARGRWVSIGGAWCRARNRYERL